MSNAHKGEQRLRFPAKLIPCTHTERGSGTDSSCSICSRVDELNRNAVDAVEQLNMFLEEVNLQYDPLQRLPVELATSIFLYLLRPPSLDIFDVSLTAKKRHALRPVPFLLGSVCRYWRRIIWSTPQFWNVLWLYVKACQPMGRNGILSEWLDRSGQLPLYVCMFMPDHITNKHHWQLLSDRGRSTAWKSIDEMIDTLNHHISRIRVLRLSLGGPPIERFGHELTTTKTNDSNLTLERLSIDVEHLPESRWDTQIYMFKLGGRMASLTHLSFENIDFQHIHVQWRNIVYLEALQISLQSALELLRLAPQMQHFKFNNPYLMGNENVKSVTHRSLTSLICDDYSGAFLSFITCPALEKLSYGPHLGHISTFLERSACGLKDLTLASYACVENKTDSLLAMFRHTPLLTRLSLNHMSSDTTYFSTFFARFHRNHPKLQLLLPHLRFFRVSCSDTCFQNFHWSSIPSMILPVPGLNDPNEKVVWRLLLQLEVTFAEAVVDPSPSEGGVHVIDRESLLKIMELVQNGVEIEIKDWEGLNLITLSQKFHNLD